MVGWWLPRRLVSMTRAELEDQVAQWGRELQRQMFQDRAGLWVVRERRMDRVVGCDAVTRSWEPPSPQVGDGVRVVGADRKGVSGSWRGQPVSG
jgi:hypothetical protein